jgi:lipopolysaccharide heptosyltransferase I
VSAAVTAGVLPNRLLVVRLGAMGDIIHTLAAVSSLRAEFPKMHIGWIIEDRWSELLCAGNTPRFGARTPQRPVADFVHVVDTKRWRKSLFSTKTKHQAQQALREVRDQHYEVAADFQGALKSALIARMSGAKEILGFQHPREWPARMFYHDKIEAHGAHVIEQYRSLAESIVGKSLSDCAATLPRDKEGEASVAKKFSGLSETFVIINPGAGWESKQWPAVRYGEVARQLSLCGLTSLVNFGPGESELALEVQSSSGGIAQPISCSISELISLTGRARLFIGGDTGPLHLAAALRVPVVAIFGPTDPVRNGPFGTKSIVVRNPASRTSLSHTRAPEPGLLAISTDEVISAARELLRSASA